MVSVGHAYCRAEISCFPGKRLEWGGSGMAKKSCGKPFGKTTRKAPISSVVSQTADGSPETVDHSPPAEKSFPIVGVGASAGGLEAFTELLEHLPATTGMAFVLIQHL